MIPYCTASGVMKNPDRNPLQSYPWADRVLGNVIQDFPNKQKFLGLDFTYPPLDPAHRAADVNAYARIGKCTSLLLAPAPNKILYSRA
jgi:hypothetical protein